MKAIDWCPQHGYPLPCAKCGLGQYEAGVKAGYNQSLKEHEWDDNYYKGKKAGIKEVVRWIEKQSSEHSNGKLYAFIGRVWQAKLKDWGINDKEG